MKTLLQFRYAIIACVLFLPFNEAKAQFLKTTESTMTYQAIPHASAPLILQNDDNTAETNFGVPVANAEYLWFNDYDISGMDFPIEVSSLDLYTFNRQCEDKFVDLYLYDDEDGNPLNGANAICESKGVITKFAFFSIAPATDIATGGPCCLSSDTQNVLVAAVNRTCQGAGNQAAALDTGVSANNSYFRTTSNLQEADPPILSSASGLENINDVGLSGNWLLRAQGTSASAMCAALLPVELSFFQAEVSGRSVSLAWRTESEENNSGFEVQAKTDNGFETLGFVAGYGTTIEEQNYRFDVGEMLPGSHIFRLKQIDFDGSVDYSNELEAVVTLPDGFVISDAYPNPFNPSTTIEIGVKKSQNVRLEVYNSLGQLIHVAFDGRVNSEQMKSVSIELEGMTSGQYILAIKGNGWEDHRVVTLAK